MKKLSVLAVASVFAFTASGCSNTELANHVKDLAIKTAVINAPQILDTGINAVKKSGSDNKGANNWKLLGTFDGSKLYVLQGSVHNGKGTFAISHSKKEYMLHAGSKLTYTSTLWDAKADCKRPYNSKRTGIYPILSKTPVYTRAITSEDRAYNISPDTAWINHQSKNKLTHQLWQAICTK